MGKPHKKKKAQKPEWTPFESANARAMGGLPDKAGAFIVGEVKEKDKKGRDVMRTYIVAPYVVGKYNGKAEKFYTLPKGGVSNTSDKAVFKGALAEVKEETGIDLDCISLEKPNGKKLSYYKDGKKLPEPANDLHAPYSNVRYLDRQQKVRDFATITYPSKAGTVHKLKMYACWVDGIEHLAKHAKGAAEFMGENAAPNTAKTAVDRAQADGLPSEAEMIEALRNGVLPATEKQPLHMRYTHMFGCQSRALLELQGEYNLWTLREEGEALPIETGKDLEKALQTFPQYREKIEREVDLKVLLLRDDYEPNTGYLFGDDEALLPQLENEWVAWTHDNQGAGQRFTTPDAIAEALEYFPEYRAPLVKQIKAIRKELEARGSISDERGVKLEDNIRPCAWVAEGADVIPLETYIDRIHAQAKQSEALIDSRTEYDATKAYSEAWFKQKGHRDVGEERLGDPNRIQHPDVQTDGEAMALAPFVGQKELPKGMKKHVSSLSGVSYGGVLNAAACAERRDGETGRKVKENGFEQDKAQHAENKRVKGKISKMLGEMPSFSEKVLARKERIAAERGLGDEAGRGAA